MSVSIRFATLDDCQVVHELSQMDELKSPDGSHAPLEYFQEFVLDPSGYNNRAIFLVAEDQGKIVGYVLGERAIGKLAILWLLAVTPTYRNKGLGLKLVRIFEQEGRRRYIVLYAPHFNKSTLAFYAQAGYTSGTLMVEMGIECQDFE